MSFIRAKEIPPRSGNWYDYEVRSVRKGSKVIQEHIRYVGRSTGPGGGIGRMARGPAGLETADMRTLPEPNPAPVSETRITKMKTPARMIASAMGMYYGGMSLDAVQQQFKQDYDLDMSESNYWNWIKRFTKDAIRQAKVFKPAVGNHWVADETYMKLGNRNVYFWDIIDAETRFLLATHVSFSRGTSEARTLMRQAAQRAGKYPRTVVTDKLGSYIGGIEDAYGAHSKHRQGGPFNIENNTNLIERFHRTLEQRTRVFAKYKNISDIRLLTGGWLVNYNFFKQHEGVGDIPPAQAMSKVVPFKDWNDIVRDDRMPDVDYKVTLHPRAARKHGTTVMDATLTPITQKQQ